MQIITVERCKTIYGTRKNLDKLIQSSLIKKKLYKIYLINLWWQKNPYMYISLLKKVFLTPLVRQYNINNINNINHTQLVIINNS